ncbi:MAG: patatin-like phospholipase family protein [Acidimicrobiales bacterium]
MTTAFVLSGGASLGAVQVGMLQGLAQAGVWPPDMLVGTSVGAINAAWVAGHPDPAALSGLEAVWQKMRRGDVFPARPLQGLRGFLGRSDHLVNSNGLRRLLDAHLTFIDLADASIPLHVVATEVTSGTEVVFSTGPAADAILASSAIPGVFAPMHIGGRVFIDGGVADNTPVSCAAALGAETIYVLPASYPCTLAGAPPTALGLIVHAINLMVHERLTVDVARYEQTCKLLVVPPLCPMSVSPVDFRHSAELIDRARTATTAWLARGDPGPDQAGVLSSPTA